jgi:hypothetical protein
MRFVRSVVPIGLINYDSGGSSLDSLFGRGRPYPKLLALRDHAKVKSRNAITNPMPRQHPRAATEFFSEMDDSQVGAQPGQRNGVAPLPPAPGQPW